MKQIILSLILLFIASSLFSQDVFKIGTITGKEVEYEVRERKNDKGKNIPSHWVIRNIHNPDTIIKPIPWRSIMTPQVKDIEMQIAEIVYKHLTRKELLELDSIADPFSVILRVDRDKYKLLQVTCFLFDNRYVAGLSKPLEEREMFYPKSYDGFWLNFDLDRLCEIEKAIVKEVELPKKLQETYLVDDIWCCISSSYICNVKKARTGRREAIEAWEKLDLIEIENFGTPLIF